MLDAVLGQYQYDIREEYKVMHECFMMIHLYIGTIFMLNYLVAILGSVYGEMGDKGAFYYKFYKYKYIERYAIAFKDIHGYYELIIHPPPVNLFLIFLLPFLW